jgi:exodeoxyribonuclease V beta subunit
MSARNAVPVRRLDVLAESLTGMCLIEASAGTGKTHTLTDLYLRLVLEGGRSVDRILVVTFTEAAKAELCERIRARLDAAREAFERDAPADPKDEVLSWLLGRLPDRAAAARRLAHAVQGFDEAAILTIHGFCQRALKESAFESGQPFETELVPDEGELLQEVVDDFWRRTLYSGSAFLVGHLLKTKTRSSPERWAKTIRPYLGKPYLAVRPPTPPPVGAEAEGQYAARYRETRALWEKDCEAIGTILLTQTALNAQKYPAKSLPVWLGEIEALLRPAEAHAGWCDRVEKFATRSLMAAAKKGSVAPTHPFFEACERLADARASLKAYLDFQTKTLTLTLRDYCDGELATRKRRRQLTAYNDLLVRLDEALAGDRGAALAEEIRRRYSAALIDEFQDTDPVQYSIFKQIYGGTDLPLFLVGDPKQAIFGFRGADIFAYLDASRDAGERRTLDRNWRSSPRLIQAVNAVFGRARDPFLFPEIPFYPVKPAEKDRKALSVAGENGPPFRFWFLPRADASRPMPKGEATTAAIQATAAGIARLLALADRGLARIGEVPLAGGDIAVLVRTNAQAGKIREALLGLGVASVQLSEAGVFESREAAEVERVLLAVAQPNREALLRAALATDLFGMSGNALEALREDEAAWEARTSAFHDYQALWRDRGFVQMFRRLMRREEAAARLLAFEDGERRLTNLLHLTELLQSAAGAEHLGMEGLIRWLAERRRGAEGSSEEAQLRLESDENLVKIATIHKSKGLQYPLVFCPFLWDVSMRDAEEGAGVLFHDPADRNRATLDAGSDRMEEAKAQARREALAESLRLAYVAVTRAEHRCTVVWGNVNGGEQSGPAYLLHQPKEPGDDPIASARERARRLDDQEVLADLDRLAVAAGGAIAVETVSPGETAAYRPASSGEEPLQARVFGGRIPEGWRVTSFSGLTAGAHREGPDYDATAESERGGAAAHPADAAFTIFDFPRGVRAGLFMHALLARLDFAQADRETIGTAVEKALREHDLDPVWQPAVTTMIENVLGTPLDSAVDGLHLRGVERGRRMDELRFYYPIAHLEPRRLAALLAPHGHGGGAIRGRIEDLSFDPVQGFMTGSMDLVFEHDGRYYLADYKSNWLGGDPDAYRADRLSRVMGREAYDLQYLIYTVALHRYLGQRVVGYDYATHFGGVFYLFVRGMSPARGADCGVFRDRPSPSLVGALDRYLAVGDGTR